MVNIVAFKFVTIVMPYVPAIGKLLAEVFTIKSSMEKTAVPSPADIGSGLSSLINSR